MLSFSYSHYLFARHTGGLSALILMETFVLLLFLSPFSFFAAPTTSSHLFPREARPTRSGYLPIGPAAAANTSSAASLFFAFYEAQQPISPLPQTPLLIWLQGGPGCSSMLGNLFELGPYLVSPDSPNLRRNPDTWNHRFGLLFIDNPLGTGFSVAPSPVDVPRNQTAVAAHLISALRHFLAFDRSFHRRPLYITGESYAGKYVPSAGYYILRQNARLPPHRRINLRGVAIGNGLTHPVTQVGTHAVSAYFTGLINERQRARLVELQDEAIRLTLAANWSAASDARGKALEWLENATGLATLYDLTKKRPYDSGMLDVFLNKEEVKAALGVAKEVVWEECSEVVGEALHADVMKSTKFMVEELVRRSRVLLYQGVYDLRDGVVSTEAWIKEMKWEGLGSFMKAKREVWKLDGELVGYVQRWGSLSHVVVYGAGHLVPADQGKSAQAMIEDWVMEKGLFGGAGA
ncbi:unnamed protein product [Musa acuminata var. zebrina]